MIAKRRVGVVKKNGAAKRGRENFNYYEHST